MSVFQEFTPISAMQRDYRGTLAKTAKGPVILALRGKPEAVLMSASDYERFVGMEAELKRLRRLIQADQDFAEMRAGHYTTLDELLAGENANPA